MGPAILRRGLRGSVPYAVKIHGSALEYTVRPDPERFLPYAREGIEGAAGILVGSHHMAERLWALLPETRERTRLGPPGVDVHHFRPAPADELQAHLTALADRLDGAAAAGWGGEAGAAGAIRALDPARDSDRQLRGQADRLEGGGPADGGLAAGGGGGAGRAAVRGGLRHLPRRRGEPDRGARPRRSCRRP